MSSKNKCKKNQLNHPWFTKRIRNFYKNKLKLYKCYLKNPINHNHIKYKQYRNKLNKLVILSEKLYYNDLFDKNFTNTKKIWQCINNIINAYSKTSDISEILYNNCFLKQPLTQHLTNILPLA